MRTLATVLVVLMTAAALSGCMGDAGPLQADFTATSEDKKTFTFDASPSSGDIAKYLWDFGDGNQSEGKTVEHTYQYVDGEYDVTLTVVDGAGVQRDTTKPVMTGSEPNAPPELIATAGARWVKPDEPVLFDAQATTDPNGDPFKFQWDFNYAFTSQELSTAVNLGAQMYNRSADVGTPNQTTDDNESSGDSPSSLAPPSQEEMKEAWARYQQWLAEQDPLKPNAEPRHGGHAEGGDPYGNPDYNAEFDGRVNDTSPLQFFSWPEPGVYIVRIAATDIKGDTTVGYFGMEVDPAAIAPEQPIDNQSGEIAYAGPDLPLGQDDETLPHNYWASTEIDFVFPGQFVVNVAIVQETESKADVLLCRSSQDLGQCRSSPFIKVENVSSGTSLSYDVNEKSAFKKFRVWVDATQDGSAGATMNITLAGVRYYDTNPWWDVEA